MEIRRAVPSDQASIVSLLVANGSPTASALEHLERFVVAIDGERLVGLAALEVHGTAALLRLGAFDAGARGLGIASELCHALLEHARERGIRDLYLRIDGSVRYYERLGFRRVCRTRVDARVVNSPEFQNAGRRATTLHTAVQQGALPDVPFDCTRDREPASDCPCEKALHDRGRPRTRWA